MPGKCPVGVYLGEYMAAVGVRRSFEKYDNVKCLEIQAELPDDIPVAPACF